MSIIKKASEIKSRDVLVFGDVGTGRTTALASLVAEYPEVLWISFNNLNGVPAKADVATPATWEEFIKEIISPAVKGELKYSAIVIEGLNTMAQMALPDKATQADWATMGKTIHSTLMRLRNVFGNLYCSADVIKNDENNDQIGFNRDLYNKIIPFFGEKWYTYVLPEVKNDKPTGNLNYLIQKNGAMALRLKPVRL